MLSRLVGAMAQGGKQLVLASAKGSAAAGALALASGVEAQAASRHAGRLAWQQLQQGTCRAYSAAEQAGNKSHRILETAVEAQLQKMMKESGKSAPIAATGAAQEAPSAASRIMGVLFDAIALGVVGLVGFSGYYTIAYRNTEDLGDMLKDARQSLKLAEAVSTAGPESAPTQLPSASSTAPPVEAAAFPPLTKAWCAVMERYLSWRKYVEKSIKDYQDPTYHKLLPDMAPELRGRIKTLVLDLDDLLVHKEWTRQTGWKIYKRPGVQDFLLEMGGYFELVIFTEATATYAEPIISKLDPHRVVMYRLFRPETQYHNGKHVRDLSKLNRDLSQVLMISSNPDAWEFQPENTIKLKPWTKDTSDTTLLDLIPMLQLIATKGVKDVRDVVKSYDGEEDIAKAFKARMAQVSDHQKQHQKRGLLSAFK